MGLPLNFLKIKFTEIRAAKDQYKTKIISWSEFKRRKASIEAKYKIKEKVYAQATIVRAENAQNLKKILQKPKKQKQLKQLIAVDVKQDITELKKDIPSIPYRVSKSMAVIIGIITLYIGYKLIK
ncbi:hypothetical protein KAU33_14240 [Candidatus Dependentiae bacterium]|nr:hypothetical protein [Candidatus Dependentiae bacterium]